MIDVEDLRIDPHPLELIKLLDHFASGWDDWEPEAVRDTLDDIEGFKDVDVNKLWDMVGALQVLKAQPDQVLRRPDIFENVGHALNGCAPTFGTWQPLSPAESAFAVLVIKEVTGKELAYPVKAYVEAILHTNGISVGIGPISDIEDRSASKSRIESTKKRFEELSGLDDFELTESDVDIEAGKLLAIKIYIDAQKV